MSAVVTLARSEYGACPQCHRPGLILNVGREHWATCRQHMVRWHVGANLFTGWQQESAQDWNMNAVELSRRRIVPPADMERTHAP